MKRKSLIESGINIKLQRGFFTRDVLSVAPELIGKVLVVRTSNNVLLRYRITETEAYRGEEDLACHASRGRTPRTEVMYRIGGHIYVYFIYGMYWMLNFVTGDEGCPQAVLVRGIEGISGPGRVTKAINIDRSFYGEDLITSKRIWIEDTGVKPQILTSPRIGINYAGEVWKNKPWRFFCPPTF